jgi:hypothetical protein
MISASAVSITPAAEARAGAADVSSNVTTYPDNDAGACFLAFIGCSAAAQYADADTAAGDSRQFIVTDLALRGLKIGFRQRDALFLCQGKDLSFVSLLQFLAQLLVLRRKIKELLQIIIHVLFLLFRGDFA